MKDCKLHAVFQISVNQHIAKGSAFFNASEIPENCTVICRHLIIKNMQNAMHFPLGHLCEERDARPSSSRKDQALPPHPGGPLPLEPRAASLFSLLDGTAMCSTSAIEQVPTKAAFCRHLLGCGHLPEYEGPNFSAPTLSCVPSSRFAGLPQKPDGQTPIRISSAPGSS